MLKAFLAGGCALDVETREFRPYERFPHLLGNFQFDLCFPRQQGRRKFNMIGVKDSESG